MNHKNRLEGKGDAIVTSIALDGGEAATTAEWDIQTDPLAKKASASVLNDMYKEIRETKARLQPRATNKAHLAQVVGDSKKIMEDSKKVAAEYKRRGLNPTEIREMVDDWIAGKLKEAKKLRQIEFGDLSKVHVTVQEE